MKTVHKAYHEALEGINIQENEKIVLKSKNCYYCYGFAKYVLGANKEKLFKVILESGDKDWINYFLKHVNFDKKKYINYLLFI